MPTRKQYELSFARTLLRDRLSAICLRYLNADYGDVDSLVTTLIMVLSESTLMIVKAERLVEELAQEQREAWERDLVQRPEVVMDADLVLDAIHDRSED
jgi:hypothetical protein